MGVKVVQIVTQRQNHKQCNVRARLSCEIRYCKVRNEAINQNVPLCALKFLNEGGPLLRLVIFASCHNGKIATCEALRCLANQNIIES